MVKVHVKVTKTDIENGTAKNAESCPIARALNRRHADRKAQVWPGVAYIRHRGKVLRAVTVVEARGFIESFDAGEAVEPCEFDLVFR